MGRKDDKKVSQVRGSLPVASHLYSAGNALGGAFTVSLNTDLFLAVITLRMLFFESFFRREAGFVTFPSDARSLIR